MPLDASTSGVADSTLATVPEQVGTFFRGGFFMPHGHCYFWKPDLVALHVLSDAAIGLTYFGISFSLYLLVRKVRLPFSPMILAFGVFIGACGLTHLIEVWNVWHGAYWLGGTVKAVTAAASVATLLYLARESPRVISLVEQTQLAEQRRLEIEIKNVELTRLSSFHAIAEMLPQLVWTAAPNGVADYYNQRWFDYTGLSLEDSKRLGWRAAVHPEDAERSGERWEQAHRTGARYELECRFKRASDGTYRWHLCRAEAIRDHDGRIAKWFGSATDIHDQKLRAEEAQNISEFHQRLVGIVSHDVRSPVAAILTTAGQLLHELPPEARHRRPVDRIDRSAKRIAKLIDLLLDYTRARLGGGIPIRLQPVNLIEICRKGIDEAEAVYPGRALVLSSEGGDDLGRWDAERLGQVIANLLDNALKYSDATTPVSVLVRGTTTDVWLEVHNQGMPVPAEVLATLFEPFRRGPQTDSVVKLSLGLGLYIVREIVERHGGAVQAVSIEAGTTFRVRLPRQPTVSDSAEPVPLLHSV